MNARVDMFAAFLGYNPIQHLVGPHVLASLSAANRATLTGRSFFPHLISGPFRGGLHETFALAIVACLIAAAASLLRGGKYHYAAPAAASNATAPHTPPAAESAVSGTPINGLAQSTPASTVTQVSPREEQHAN